MDKCCGTCKWGVQHGPGAELWVDCTWPAQVLPDCISSTREPMLLDEGSSCPCYATKEPKETNHE